MSNAYAIPKRPILSKRDWAEVLRRDVVPAPLLTPRRQRDTADALRELARRVRRPVAEVQAVVWVVIRREAGEEA